MHGAPRIWTPQFKIAVILRAGECDSRYRRYPSTSRFGADGVRKAPEGPSARASSPQPGFSTRHETDWLPRCVAEALVCYLRHLAAGGMLQWSLVELALSREARRLGMSSRKRPATASEVSRATGQHDSRVVVLQRAHRIHIWHPLMGPGVTRAAETPRLPRRRHRRRPLRCSGGVPRADSETAGIAPLWRKCVWHPPKSSDGLNVSFVTVLFRQFKTKLIVMWGRRATSNMKMALATNSALQPGEWHIRTHVRISPTADCRGAR